MFSVGPVFPDQVHGGSQKILRLVALHLGSQGHSVEVYCTRRPDNRTAFALSDSVLVRPSLKLKPTYPEPYYTAPYHIADLIEQLERAAQTADVLYIHDAELPFHDVVATLPRVVSFRDFVYPDTLVGAFGFRRDTLVLNCDYVRDCVVATMGPMLPGINERIRVIRNGIDLSHFKPLHSAASESIRELYKFAPTATFTVLYPHRPDRKKGIYESIDVLSLVNRRLQRTGRSARLLIPRWMDSAVATDSSHEYQTIYADIGNYAREKGVQDFVHIHPWVPFRDMPAYLSSGDAALCVGNFVEAFGNVHLEASACGTPTIVANVAGHSRNLPEPFVHRVPFGDAEAGCDALLDALIEDYPTEDARRYLEDQYSYGGMLSGYAEVLTSARVSAPLRVRVPPSLRPDDRLSLAPWCRLDGDRLYCDYQYGHCSEGWIVRLVQAVNRGATPQNLLRMGIAVDQIATALRNGIVVHAEHERGQVLDNGLHI